MTAALTAHRPVVRTRAHRAGQVDHGVAGRPHLVVVPPRWRQPGAAASRRRRAVVSGLAAVTLVVLGGAAHDVLTGPGDVPASAAGTGTALPRSVRAERGDTLWGIAQSHHGAVPLRHYVDELLARNGGSAIEAGEVIYLP